MSIIAWLTFSRANETGDNPGLVDLQAPRTESGIVEFYRFVVESSVEESAVESSVEESVVESSVEGSVVESSLLSGSPSP